MLRTIAGLVAGLMVGILALGLMLGIGQAIFPPPQDTQGLTVEQIGTMHRSVGTLISTLIAWGLGAAAGGMIAAWIARVGLWPAYVIGAIIFATAAWIMMMIAHPWWMWLGAPLFIGGGAWLGGQAAARLSHD